MTARHWSARWNRWVMPGAILFVLATSPAWARQQPDDGTQLGPALAPMEVQRLLDAYVIVQAQEALQLSDAQYPQFLAKLKALQDVRRRNEQSRLRLIAELNRLSNGRTVAEGREPQIRERLKALDDLEGSSAFELRRARDELAQTLDVRQQARFRVFEEQMERRKLQLLQRAQNRPRQLRP